MTRTVLTAACLALTLLFVGPTAQAADKYSKTVKLFKESGESRDFFGKSYGYAVFPPIGKGGMGIGGAYGKGEV